MSILVFLCCFLINIGDFGEIVSRATSTHRANFIRAVFLGLVNSKSYSGIGTQVLDEEVKGLKYRRTNFEINKESEAYKVLSSVLDEPGNLESQLYSIQDIAIQALCMKSLARVKNWAVKASGLLSFVIQLLLIFIEKPQASTEKRAARIQSWKDIRKMVEVALIAQEQRLNNTYELVTFHDNEEGESVEQNLADLADVAGEASSQESDIE